jgi:hypothetical protein
MAQLQQYQQTRQEWLRVVQRAITQDTPDNQLTLANAHKDLKDIQDRLRLVTDCIPARTDELARRNALVVVFEERLNMMRENRQLFSKFIHSLVWLILAWMGWYVYTWW